MHATRALMRRMAFVAIGAHALLAAGPLMPACSAAEKSNAAAVSPLQFAEVPAAGTVKFIPTSSESHVAEHFRLEPHEFTYKTKFLRTNAAVRKFSVTFPSPVETDVAENNTVHAVYFQPAGLTSHPGAVVLHILGGDFLLSEAIANHLAQHGIASLFVKMPYYGERRGKDSPRRMLSRIPDESVAAMTQAVLDIRRAAAWLGARHEVDPDRLGITGISLGGIMTALAATGEPRFRNVAIYLAGGNFADFIWSHEDKMAAEFRKGWIAAGGTQETFATLISRIDPVTYGHILKDRRVLMVAASHDEVIAPRAAIALWESAGKTPKLVWLDAGHYTAAKFLPRELIRLDLFFNGSPK